MFRKSTYPAQLPHVIDRAIRLALARRGPSVIIIPKDVQEQPFEAPKRAHGFTRSGPGYSRPSVVPKDEDLRKAADVLNAGNKVAMLIGAGAAEAADEVVAVAEKLGAGVAKALLGKSVLPDDLPFVTGCIGLLGTKPSSELMNGCDTLLIDRQRLPLVGVPAEERPGARGPDRRRCRDAFASLSLRSEPPRHGGGDSAASPADARAQDRPQLERRDRRLAEGLVADARGTRQDQGASRSTRNGWCGRCRRACPTMRSSPATAARAPTGTPATTG